MTPLGGETQPERTALSWQRTALGVLAVAGLLGHRAVVNGSPPLVVAAGACALLGVGLLAGVAVDRDRRARAAAEAGGPVAVPRLVATATVAVVLVALAALLAVLVHRLS